MKIRRGILLACLILFALDAAAQTDVAASEIEGFRFSTHEKVKLLTLLVSSREDVQAIFGKDCVRGCRLNDDWDISFAYVNSGWAHGREENGKVVVYKPAPEIINKLADINLKPRRAIVLPELTFYPPALKCSEGIAERGTLRYKSILCTDHRSLAYSIYGETNEHEKFQKNQIRQITYTTIPTDRIFTHISHTVPSSSPLGLQVDGAPQEP